MASTKAKSVPRNGELPEEFRTRQIMARCQVRAAREFERQQKAALKEIASLATYRAAKVDRRNRDWTQGNASADLAIIPDAMTLIARGRQLVRDFPLAQSAVRAFRRNVVGNGIAVNPHAKYPDGRPMTEFNRVAGVEWGRWSKSKACHVEGVQTYRQMQRLAASERFTVGEHLIMWSYAPPTRANGRTDLSKPCGLQLQAWEPEQFDLRLITYEGNEVRGGVEIDENYKPVGYHLYTRNPWDVLYRHAFFSMRVPAQRMFHYMDHERVLQSRGVSPLACIMQTLRDLERYNSAILTRGMMEACIGLIIKTQMPITGPGTTPTLKPISGDSGETQSGLTEADFAPGMVAKLRPGEEVETMIPTTPGSQYPPFLEMNTRIAGAGVGMSYGQIMRHNDANFSAARQDMLEDRKEYTPEQTLIIDDFIGPTYERFLTFAVAEGRFNKVPGFDPDDYHENKWRYVEADYVPPPMSWIDPEKEANAYKTLIELNLITREQIAAERGEKFLSIVMKKSGERKAMIGAGLQVVEDADDLEGRRDIVKAYLASRDPAVSATAVNHSDVAQQIADAGLADRDSQDQSDLPLTPTATPSPGASRLNGNGQSQPLNGNGKLHAAPNGRRVVSLAVQDAPHYRMSREPKIVDCTSCSFAAGERCTKFNFLYAPEFVCDAWAARTLTENIGNSNTAKTFPPFHQDGDPPIENQFWPSADQAKMYPGKVMS